MTELIAPPAKATFRAMSEGTLEDWQSSARPRV